jgi:hypothetical protein
VSKAGCTFGQILLGKRGETKDDGFLAFQVTKKKNESEVTGAVGGVGLGFDSLYKEEAPALSKNHGRCLKRSWLNVSGQL